jgi:sugar lactone lactonase YvrE
MQCRRVAVALFPLYCAIACTEGTRERDSGVSGRGGASGAVGTAGSYGTAGAAGSVGQNPVCPAKGGAQLEVVITGLPEGVDADVIVGGPIEAWGVNSSRSLGNVVGGPYLVKAERVAGYDPIVRTMYDVQLEEAEFCLSEGETHAVTVHYQPVTTSHQLWTNSSNGTGDVLSFAAANLEASSTGTEPAVTVTGGAGKDLTFDALGNLWAMGATVSEPHLMRFPAATLGDSGNKIADRRIDIDGIPCAPALHAFAFDLFGSLWVSTCGGRVSRLSPNDLAGSGTVAPAVTISNLTDNGDLAFDYSNNLWITDSGKVLRYDAARLEGATDQSADLSLQVRDQADTRDLEASNLVFDATGGLWLIDFGSNQLARIGLDAQALAGSRTVIAEKTIAIGVTALLERPAFDESGGLWLALDQNRFGRLSSQQLAVNSDIGSPTLPETLITSPGMGNANRMAFYPAPADLPLYHHFR